ncbi:MAG: SCO family protein [Pseudomonadota bacterium]
MRKSHAAVCAAWLLIAATFMAPTAPAAGDDGAATLRVAIGGPFELVDQNGEVRSDSDFRGQFMLVYFGYNWCPDICPTTLWQVSAALDRLGEQAGQVQPIYITVDPERDTVDSMKYYASHFHPSLVALTGSQAQIADVASAYQVEYAKSGNVDGDDYYVDHTAYVFLMDPSGNFLRLFSHEALAEEIASGVLDFM